MPLAQTPVRSHRRGVAAVGLSVLMLLVYGQPHGATLHPFIETAARSTYYTPQGQAQGVNTTSTGVLHVPRHRTFSGGRDRHHTHVVRCAGHRRTLRSGRQHGLERYARQHAGDAHGGQLSLSVASTVGSITDFETLIETLPDWVGHGPNHSVWNVAERDGTTSSSTVPSSATQGVRVLTTGGENGWMQARGLLGITCTNRPCFCQSVQHDRRPLVGFQRRRRCLG